MESAGCIAIRADDLAARIDTAGKRENCAGEVQCRELAVAQQEAVRFARRVPKRSHDVAPRVDRPASSPCEVTSVAEGDGPCCSNLYIQVVELRFFGGLTVDETAVVLEISPVTVRRDWRAAKIWLYRELTDGSVAPPERSAE